MPNFSSSFLTLAAMSVKRRLSVPNEFPMSAPNSRANAVANTLQAIRDFLHFLFEVYNFLMNIV